MIESRDDAIRWARKILEIPRDRVLFLDTETCGVTVSEREIIELGIINAHGDVVYHSRFFPLLKISEGATKVHRIKLSDLHGAPTWNAVIRDQIDRILSTSEMVVMYNATFDTIALRTTCALHHTEPLSSYTVNDLKIAHNRWSAPGSHLDGDHSAIGDCRAMFLLLQKMADSSLSYRPLTA